ncbi:hypothetical protein NMG60_11023052 [Bertholletia excelsa]
MGRSSSLKVAVIGAGASGLAAARELQREDHQVVVFEKLDRLGGMWVYDPRVESDELGIDPTREIAHGSLYFSLRTNLPRQIMGFTDYPFDVKERGDSRHFPGHEEVLRFLGDFAGDFGISGLIRFESEVIRVEQVDSGWVVEARSCGSESSVEEAYDAVVVCTGHHTQPRVAHVPGIQKWRGQQVHSHNYRQPEPYRNQVVVMIGNGPSAYDISREVATAAKEVHLSSRKPGVTFSKFDNYPNMWQHSEIAEVYEDGRVAFQDGSSVYADTIFHCTGYKYTFPFLKTNGVVSVEDGQVGPLYKHVFPPKLAPSLSFVGIVARTLPFPLSELQSRWIAQVLSGKILLPPEEEMLADVEEHYRHMKENGIPKHHTHVLNDCGFEYMDWLAAQVDLPSIDEQAKVIYRKLIMFLASQNDGFKDEFDPETYCGRTKQDVVESNCPKKST